MAEPLADETLREIARLCRAGDRRAQRGLYRAALQRYLAALELLPEPRHEHPPAQAVLGSIGDIHFFRGRHAEALPFFADALTCADAAANPYLHLRLGQVRFELGQRDGAAASLGRALALGGVDIFLDEDPKYLAILHSS